MSRTNKITWDDIYKDFKRKRPLIAKNAVGFNPYDYATIIIVMIGGGRIIYNYDTKGYRELTEEEIHEWNTNKSRRSKV